MAIVTGETVRRGTDGWVDTATSRERGVYMRRGDSVGVKAVLGLLWWDCLALAAQRKATFQAAVCSASSPMRLLLF